MANDQPGAESRAHQEYKKHQQQREALASSMEEQAQVLRSLGMAGPAESVDERREDLLHDDFKDPTILTTNSTTDHPSRPVAASVYQAI